MAEDPAVRALEAEVEALKAEVERLRRENRRWARLAGTDPLSGLPNKISFLKALLPQVLQQAAREGRPLGLMLLAADNLGSVNQERGRDAGDEVVRGLSKLVQSLIGDSARLGHLDGTHFAGLVYPAAVEEVRGKANMVRARIRGHEFPCEGGTVQITVSAGVTAVYARPDENLQAAAEQALRQLNQALHLAKKAGGNRVEVVVESLTDGKEAPR